MEDNLTNETQIFSFPGYSFYLLPKFRKIASGILVGVKNSLIANFDMYKQLGESEDKSKIVRIDVWKEYHHYKIYALYPACKSNLSVLTVEQKTVVIRGMKSHSLRWGYDDSDASGREFKDLLNSSSLEIIFDASDPPIYLHYNGSDSNPDLLSVSSDLRDY
ncbi:hypothetical protein NPIL_501871 [Nephila pilipes]|uniref:Uncharacterized protein n=1 Tax=Nephila pilipes TaxID=299642 RepID=A0A8X6MND9_NEPPI|nr:hypothetical protein NPIL_501871 [Nephila pilipes]